jgi:cysteine desulfurase
MTRRIYLDFNATTPVAPEVADAVSRVLRQSFGNPSSSHWAGRNAKGALDRARAEVAALLACAPEEVVFTSGGSESNNIALKGVWWALGRPQGQIVTTAVEHPSILRPGDFLASLGARVTILPVDRFGRVDPDDVRKSLTPETVLVSVMHAQNEVGTLQPIAEIAAITRERGVLLHSDAAQSAGKIETRVDDLGVDLLTLAGHKLYAPKGVGALYLRRGVTVTPLVHGAGQERGLRAGTENLALAVGLGQACSLARQSLGRNEIQDLRDRLWNGLKAHLGERVALMGHPEARLPNTLNVCFVGRSSAEVLSMLPDVAISAGSACHSGSPSLSPVLEAMGVAPELGLGAVRFSLGRTTTAEEIDAVLAMLRDARPGAS